LSCCLHFSCTFRLSWKGDWISSLFAVSILPALVWGYYAVTSQNAIQCKGKDCLFSAEEGATWQGTQQQHQLPLAMLSTYQALHHLTLNTSWSRLYHYHPPISQIGNWGVEWVRDLLRITQWGRSKSQGLKLKVLWLASLCP
jgi:hypothetical protein